MFNRDMIKETEKIIEFIRETFKQKEFSKAVIGISGGLDSAVVAALLVEALGKENVYGYMLPYHLQYDASDAGEVARHLDINFDVINIGDIVDQTKKYLQLEDKYITRIGNIKARIRMIILYDLSTKHEALVVGTGNKTELLLGYFTLYGDGACALEPIGHLYKTEVKQLAKYLEIPKQIIDKAPSADLWEGQTDEKELGISYKEIDEWLYLAERHKVATGQGVWSQEKWISIKDRIEKNNFKHESPKMIRE